MMIEGLRFAEYMDNEDAIDGIHSMKINDHPSSCEWSEDTVLYSIQDVGERGNINGHLAAYTEGRS